MLPKKSFTDRFFQLKQCFSFYLIALTAIFAFGANLINAQTCAPAPVGMVNWYPGEGNTNDIRGGENGTLKNSATYTAGEVGQAFSSNSTNGWVSAPAAANLQRLTIAGWFYLNSYAGDYPTLFERGSSGSSRIGLSIVNGTTELGILNGGNIAGVSANGVIPLNQWSFVALTVTDNGPNKDLTVYVNGTAVISVINTPIASDNSGMLGIGNTASFQSNPLNGNFDEIQVFNRGLSQAEVQAIYNAGSAGLCPITCSTTPVGLTDWYPADNNPKDIRGIQDASTFGNVTYSAGKTGQAFDLPGGHLQGYVTTPTLNLGSQFSVELWMRPTDLAANRVVIGGDKFSSNFGSLYFYHAQSLTYVQQGSFRNITSDTLLAAVWTHVVLTYDGSVSRIYINGTLESTSGAHSETFSNPVRIGQDYSEAIDDFKGQIDEPSFYNRALSASEIQTLYNAGGAGKCKPTAVTPPSGLVAWYPGDGDANDFQGGSTLTFAGAQGVSYAVGKVGQALSLPGGYLQGYAVTPVLNLGSAFSVETWFRPTDVTAGGKIIIGNDTFSNNFGSIYQDGTNLYYYQGFGAYRNTAAGVLSANTWTHVVMTYDGSVSRMYINGVLNDTSAVHTETFNNAVRIGQNFNESLGDFNGLIDEPSFYNRVLTPTEISAIYDAGLAGKLKQVATSGSPVTVGDATVTFSSVTSSGVTQEVPLDLSSFPAFPAGAATGLAYDIATSASYTGSPTVCFNLPALAANFANLRIYHLEGGSWADVTGSGSSPNLCTVPLSSLSPFAIANVMPTAALEKLGGHVLTLDNVGIRNAEVTLTGGDLTSPLHAMTNKKGDYSFSRLTAGKMYVVSVSASGYTFSTSVLLVNLRGSVSDADFVAAESSHTKSHKPPKK